MKRTLYLIVAYYLFFQAGIGALSVLSAPENAVILLALSGFSAYGGYLLNRKAQSIGGTIENIPTKELDVPETQPLDRK